MLSSLSLIIFSFWFKMRNVWLFLSLEHLEAIVGLLIGLNIAMSQGIERPEGREKDGGTAGWWASKNTHNIYGWSFSSVEPPNNYNSHITDHHNKSSISEKVWSITKKLPRYDTETWSEKMLLEKCSQQTRLMKVTHRTDLQCIKNEISVKQSKVKYNKMRSTCMVARIEFTMWISLF